MFVKFLKTIEYPLSEKDKKIFKKGTLWSVPFSFEKILELEKDGVCQRVPMEILEDKILYSRHLLGVSFISKILSVFRK